jgi:hypothetical protein
LCNPPPTVTLGEALPKLVSKMALERGVEGPREYVLCHADLGSSTQTPIRSFSRGCLADC